MRAASFGLPFQPLAGLEGSEIPEVSRFARIKDPYSEQWVYAIPAIRPDWALVQVPEADARGNARVYGSPFWDRILARAARRTIVVTERLVPTEELARAPELTLIPELFVEAVVHLPRGAQPTSCPPCYAVDEAAVWRYLELSRTPEGVARYLEETRASDHVVAAVSR